MRAPGVIFLRSANVPAAPGKEKAFKSMWPAPAQALAHSLLRTDQLAKLTGGIEIIRQSDSFDVR